jgi:SNF2 family DNA or RNA helicase
METGTGKTLVAIKLMEYWGVPAMVVAPLSTIESVWKREIEKWSELRSTILWQNLKDFDKNFDVYLINYEQFKILSSKSKIPIEKKVQCLIIDESSKMKNPQSQITKTILKYKNNIKYRLVLSGTPSPNSLLEFWAQMEFINEDLL